MIDGFTAHRGSHCESSAMLNLLSHQGYRIGEEQIIGAGSALGFFLGSTPFPFLGGRSLRLKENFEESTGIALRGGSEETDGRGWEKIFDLIARGIPVVLRVDMRYLPYLYGGKYGPRHMSFGWHMVCLCGWDGDRRIAFLTDTDRTGPQEIRLRDLDRARFSKTKIFPPGGEYYWTEKAKPDFSFDWERIALESLDRTEQAMGEAPPPGDELTGLDGLSRYAGALAALDRRVKPYLLAPVLAFHYGCIETNGTGGAAFRKMYYHFLKEAGEASGNVYLLAAANLLRPAMEGWTELALAMMEASRDRVALGRGEKRRATLGSLSRIGERIYEGEKKFYSLIEEQRRVKSE